MEDWVSDLSISLGKENVACSAKSVSPRGAYWRTCNRRSCNTSHSDAAWSATSGRNYLAQKREALAISTQNEAKFFTQQHCVSYNSRLQKRQILIFSYFFHFIFWDVGSTLSDALSAASKMNGKVALKMFLSCKITQEKTGQWIKK